MSAAASIRKRNSPLVSYDDDTLAMLNSVEFPSSSSSSTSTTPRRRNPQKSRNSVDSNATATESTIDSHVHTPTPVHRAKKKIFAAKIARLNEFLDMEESELCLRTADLRSFARSEGGLITDQIRAKIWPALANATAAGDMDGLEVESITESSCSDSDFETARSTMSSSEDCDTEDTGPTIDELKRHPEWNQVEMDVHRTLARFPPGTSEDERVSLQTDLIPLIVRVLSENCKFRYYQGFHDICLTLILVLGTESAFRVARILSHRTVFKRYLTKSLEESAMADLQYMFVLLFKHNKKLELYLREAELGTLFALSWPLTWFSHVLDDYQQVVMCFDVFLASDPLMPIYVAAAMLQEREVEIFNTEQDMPALHHLLSNVPADINMTTVLAVALDLFQQYPPSQLRHTYQREYDAECEASRYRHAPLPPANTMTRYSINKWITVGAVSAAAFYLIWSSQYLEAMR
uniref:Rab-GAP TBC domain-containing protein n=1 Tax=Panagrellus redivivus TaxID=6233 RepID=A0A7E5A152_PANRE